MKKLFTMLALMLVTVTMAVSVAGCGNTSSAPTKEEFDSLKSEMAELKEDIKDLNVFWTDKKEYSQTETMTVYFGQTAVFKIRLKEFEWVNTSGSSSRGTINIDLFLTSLCADILEDSIVTSTYLSWSSGTYICPPSTNSTPPHD